MSRLFALLLAACLAAPVFAADEAALLDDARKVAGAIPPKLLTVLNDEIKAGGAENAIAVCREKAPKMAAAASAASGWNIRRVSLKNRNPKATPDAWERATLEDFERRTAAGEKPTSLEKGELVSDGGQQIYRYMKALPTQDLCLACHGTADNISAPVKAKLAELYPEDKAFGYGLAEIRGANTLKRPL